MVAAADIMDARLRLYAGEASPMEQRALERVAGRCPVAFMRLGMWSRRVKRVDPVSGNEYPVEPEDRLEPFLPWPEQERITKLAVQCVRDGRDTAWGKTRETGASTLATGIIWWGWRWHGWDPLVCSRTQDLVDRSGDPDTLFAKLDTITRNVPRAFLPAGCSREDFLADGRYRRSLILEHPGGNSVTGEATTAHIGRGARKTLVLFDEAAAQERFEAGWRSAADTTLSRWAVSTHLVGSYFSSVTWPKAVAEGDPVPIVLSYTHDPDKGHGAEDVVDVDGSITGDPGRVYTTTPWLRRQIKRRDLIDLRENVFAMPTGSGRSFFPAAAIERARVHACPPRRCEAVRGVLTDSPAGRWRVWREPDRRTAVAVFADPAYGTGAANGVAAMFDVDARELIAMFVDPACPPYELSQEMVGALRSWARGRADGMIGWETNGPGGSMHHDLERLRWSSVYRQRAIGTASEKRTKRMGWTSTRPGKRMLLGDLSRALLDGTVVIPCAETIGELEQTIVYRDGSIGPARLEVDATSGAREAHGDRVIAVAGGLMLCDELAGIGEREGNAAPLPDFSAASVLGIEPDGNGGWRPSETF